MIDSTFKTNIDYRVYNKILSYFIDCDLFYDDDELIIYILAYLQALLDFKIINFDMYFYCKLNIRKDLKEL